MLVVGAGLAALGSGLGSCNIYTEKLLEPDPRFDGGLAGSAGTGAAGSGGSAAAGATGGAAGSGGSESCSAGQCWWSTTTPEGCKDHRAPTGSDRPAAGATNEIAPFYLAIDQLWLGETAPGSYPTGAEAWQFFGLNLDGVCTNSPNCPSAPKNVVSCRAGIGTPPDGVGCRDNMFARLEPVAADQPSLGGPFGISENAFNCELHRGSFSILIKVSGYNGEANDDQVRLDFYMSPGVDRVQAWECPDAGWENRAPWLASFPWKVNAAMLSGQPPGTGQLANSTLNDPDAFVKSGYLVGDLPDGAEMRFIGDNAVAAGFSLKFFKGLFVARPVLGNDGLWAAEDGLLAGRVKQGDMLSAFNQIGFCVGGALPGGGTIAAGDTNLLVDYLRVNMDIMSTGEVNADTDCDAMSVGIGFTARQATPGAAVAVSPLTDCPNGGTPGAF